MKLQTILLFFALALVFWMVYAKMVRPLHPYSEGFTQGQKYLLKENKNAYDAFYAGVHDSIYCSKQRAAFDIMTAFNATHPSVNHSRILDMGSGTGCLIALLRGRGYRAYGIDRSDAMSDAAEMKCGACDEDASNERIINRTDMMDAMAFDKQSFSHAFCTGFTLYEVEDKNKLFANAYSWLQPGGHFIVHVVDPKEFRRIVPVARPAFDVAGPKRVNKCRVQFDGFTYDAEYAGKGETVTLKEKFTDMETNKVRVNEIALRMPEPGTIETIARNAGFILKGKAHMKKAGDSNQWLYTFER